ncbi:MAG TPA: glycosyltransferase, partial [Terriglobales bacterium]|nr:glycosyltransferase [Terriglobales bacterium]
MGQNLEKKKKVLITTYYFPPLGMGGVQRVSKFVKYLPSFGWEPVVLTVKDIDYFSRDDSLLQELPPDVKIYRAGSFDPLRWLYLFKNQFRREKQKSDPKRVALRNTRGASSSAFVSFLNLFLFPDNKIGWFPFALIKGIKVCRTEKIDLLFSTYPPLTCHLVGFFLKKLTGIKWVTDYRDSYINYQDARRPDSIKNRLLKNLQKSFLKRADGVICVNQTIDQELEEIQPNANEIEIITNGYDREDFEVKVEKSKAIFRIIYFGTFSPDCPAEAFLKALSNLLHQGKIDQDKIRFVHVGISLGMNIEKEIKEFGLQEITELKGYLSHKKGVEELLKSDLALLTVSQSAPIISTGKIYEYLGAKKPVLAIVPQNGEAAKLIQLLGAGRAVSPENIRDIEEALVTYFREFETGNLRFKANS